MSISSRSDIYPGLVVWVVKKENQKTGILTKGAVQDILTSKPFHPRGIKVRLESGIVGRVIKIAKFQQL